MIKIDLITGFLGSGKTRIAVMTFRLRASRVHSLIVPIIITILFWVVPLYADEPVPGYIMASSTLNEPGYDHGAWLVQDYDVSTAWTEGAPGNGMGESLYLETDRYAVITGGVICTGYYRSEDLFWKNGAPTRIFIHTGNQEAYLDVSEDANTYSAGYEGFHFRFDEPLVSDGSVTMTIVGVRDGQQWQDACISELRLEGYQATADTAPDYAGGTPHVSLVLPADDVEFGEMTGYPDGLGSDGRGPDEVGGYTQDPEYLDGETTERLRAFTETIYKIQTRHAGAEDVEINAEDLYGFSHAGALNWYQANVLDGRISRQGAFNYAYEEDLKEIVGELFETQSPQEDVQALCDYFGAVREGEMIRMNAGGNEWNNDTYYLREPAGAGFELGKTVLIGSVMEYNPGTQGYIHTKTYHAIFTQDSRDPNVFRFDGLFVS